jgi:Fur family ferric uptake transcriptional regulator
LSNNTEKLAWFWDKLNTFLELNQLKQTRQRKLIVENFLDIGPHVTAEDLHKNLQIKNSHIGLATIYRTLNLLKQIGLIEQKQNLNDKSFFELVQPEKHHDHLICIMCGRIEEFVDDEIEYLQKKVCQRMNFYLMTHRLDLHGYCQDCQVKR